MRTLCTALSPVSLSAPALAQDAVARSRRRRRSRQESTASSSSTSPAASARRCRSRCRSCRRPQRPTPPAGNTAALGRQVAEIVAADLRNSELFTPIGPSGLNPVTFPQVTAPDFGYFATTGAQNLVQGFVQANPDGAITVGCYLYDVAARSELARQGYVVQPRDWRRAAHRCADSIFSRLTGEGAYFDTRIVYVSETGPARRRVKRLGDHGL